MKVGIMKKILVLAAMFMSMTALSAHADNQVMGFIYKEATEPGGGSGSVAVSRVGCSTAKSVFGLVAFGDCSIQSAMKKGKITNLSHYDIFTQNILGFKTVTTKAYGQ